MTYLTKLESFHLVSDHKWSGEDTLGMLVTTRCKQQRVSAHHLQSDHLRWILIVVQRASDVLLSGSVHHVVLGV